MLNIQKRLECRIGWNYDAERFLLLMPKKQREVMVYINQIPKGQQTPYSLPLRLLDRKD